MVAKGAALQTQAPIPQWSYSNESLNSPANTSNSPTMIMLQWVTQQPCKPVVQKIQDWHIKLSYLCLTLNTAIQSFTRHSDLQWCTTTWSVDTKHELFNPSLWSWPQQLNLFTGQSGLERCTISNCTGLQKEPADQRYSRHIFSLHEPSLWLGP